MFGRWRRIFGGWRVEPEMARGYRASGAGEGSQGVFAGAECGALRGVLPASDAGDVEQSVFAGCGFRLSFAAVARQPAETDCPTLLTFEDKRGRQTS